MNPAPGKTRFHKTVVLFGTASFFNDLASKMVAPLLPVFLVTALGAGPLAVGVIDGLAQTIASLSRLVSGQVADKTGRGKALILLGYGVSNICRPLLAFAPSWGFAAALKAGERFGKGIRTPVRDAAIVGITPRGSIGRAFGLNRMLDYLGSFLGPIIASALLLNGFEISRVFVVSAVPGGIAVVVVFLALRFLPPSKPKSRALSKSVFRLPRFDLKYKNLIAVAAFMALAAVPESFLILWLMAVGVGPSMVPLVWAGASAVKVCFAFPAGKLADRFGSRPVLFSGWTLKVAALCGLSLATGLNALSLTAFGLFVALSGATDPVEKALLGRLVAKTKRGAAFGLYQMVAGLLALPAAFIFSFIWKALGFQSAFFYSAVLTLLASAFFYGFFLHNKKGKSWD